MNIIPLLVAGNPPEVSWIMGMACRLQGRISFPSGLPGLTEALDPPVGSGLVLRSLRASIYFMFKEDPRNEPRFTSISPFPLLG